MYEESFLTPMEEERPVELNGASLFIDFLNQLEGWKTKGTNLHWEDPKKNIHVYLDEFLSVLYSYTRYK